MMMAQPCQVAPLFTLRISLATLCLRDVIICQVVILLLCLFTATHSLPPSPHLVVVLVDSWSSSSTPLVEEGILIPNYYSPPVKGAALTSLLSGKYPHKSQPITSNSLNCSLLLGGLLRYFPKIGRREV